MGVSSLSPRCSLPRKLTSLAGVLAAVAELEVVDHDELDAVRAFHAARAGAHVGDVERARVVDEDRRAAEGVRGRHQALARVDAFLASHESALKSPCVHAGAAGEHALGERLGAHFEGEDEHGVLLAVVAARGHAVDVLPHRDALGDVHGKRGLAHGRTRRDDDHVAALETHQLLVEVLEACGKAVELPRPAVEEAVHGLEGILYGRLPFHAHGACAADFEEVLLHLAEEDVRIRSLCLVETARLRLACALDHRTQEVFLADDIDVVFGMRRGGRVVHERLDSGDAADLVEAARRAETIRERDRVDRHGRAAHLAEGLEEDAVSRLVEGLGREAARLAEIQHAGVIAHRRIQQDRPDDAAFGLRAVGKCSELFGHGKHYSKTAASGSSRVVKRYLRVVNRLLTLFFAKVGPSNAF